jgi:diacylglycerol kinase (ATP)
MTNTHWFFVINPVSGNRKGLALWKIVKEKLEYAKVDFSFAVSDFHKHTVQLVQEKQASGCRHFIGIGGDGTLNEMVNGIMNSSITEGEITLGLIPVGTGNDWVKSQEEPLSADTIVAKLKQNRSRLHNVGKVEMSSEQAPYYFMNIAGAGIDGAIVNTLEVQNKKGKAGQWVYVKSLVKTLFTYKTPIVKIEVDSEPLYDGRSFLVAASLGKYFGSGMFLSPKADFNSGTLNFTLAKKDKLYRVFPQLHKLFNGKIETASFVEKRNGKHLSISSIELLQVQADGELVGETKTLSFSISPVGIKVLV